MNKVTQNIERCHVQVKNLEAILILLENAYLENNATDVAYYSKRYAKQLTKMAAPHIEEALTDDQWNRLKDEVFASTDYEIADTEERLRPKIRVALHEEIKVPSIAHNI